MAYWCLVLEIFKPPGSFAVTPEGVFRTLMDVAAKKTAADAVKSMSISPSGAQ